MKINVTIKETLVDVLCLKRRVVLGIEETQKNGHSLTTSRAEYPN
jgi:hypothetical protein